MRSIIVLSLTSSTLAMPFGNVFNAMFGADIQERHVPPPDLPFPLPPFGTGTGTIHTGTGFPTATGFPCPTATGISAQPFGPISRPQPPKQSPKKLRIDYQLAPTTTTLIDVQTPVAQYVNVKMAKEKRQLGTGTSALPSFSLLNPSDAPAPFPTPSADEPSFPLPTQDPESPFPTNEPELPFPTNAPEFPFPTQEPGFPTAAPNPTGGFPGFPGTPTTLATLTRGPRPTQTADLSLPEFPGESDGSNWWEQLQDLIDRVRNGAGQGNGNGFGKRMG